jgi:hypothetical protein
MEYGGLGDQLFYTQIPELLKRRNPNCVVNISCANKFRSKDVTEFIWYANPFVDSVDEFIKDPVVLAPKTINHDDNIVAQVTKKAGLDCDSNACPKLYNDIPLHPYYQDKVVGAFSKQKVKIFLLRYENVVFLNKPSWLKLGESVKVTDITEYASIIMSAKTFVTFTSGGATLACSLGKPAVCIFGKGQDPIFHHCCKHKYTELSHSNFISFFINIVLSMRLQLRMLKERKWV